MFRSTKLWRGNSHQYKPNGLWWPPRDAVSVVQAGSAARQSGCLARPDTAEVGAEPIFVLGVAPVPFYQHQQGPGLLHVHERCWMGAPESVYAVTRPERAVTLLRVRVPVGLRIQTHRSFRESRTPPSRALPEALDRTRTPQAILREQTRRPAASANAPCVGRGVPPAFMRYFHWLASRLMHTVAALVVVVFSGR